MYTLPVNKLIYSIATVLIIHLLSGLAKRAAKRTQNKLSIKKSRYFAIRRSITIAAMFFSLIALILIWQVDVKQAWISLTGVLALVAVAFFAVWSLVGNILAGVIIYFTSPFKIDDVIELMPDSIRGTVLAINTFYTVLQDEEMNYINIPNSLFFQKYIKVLRRPKKPAVPAEGTK
jgi:small-conductance mechanosensitive channel